MTMMITTIEEQVMDACSFFLRFWSDGNVAENSYVKKEHADFYGSQGGFLKSWTKRSRCMRRFMRHWKS